MVNGEIKIPLMVDGYSVGESKQANGIPNTFPIPLNALELVESTIRKKGLRVYEIKSWGWREWWRIWESWSRESGALEREEMLRAVDTPPVYSRKEKVLVRRVGRKEGGVKYRWFGIGV